MSVPIVETPECLGNGMTMYKLGQEGGAFMIPCCEECNRSKWAHPRKAWLRTVRDEWPEKWEEILEHHYWRRNWLSQLVHEVRDEW